MILLKVIVFFAFCHCYLELSIFDVFNEYINKTMDTLQQDKPLNVTSRHGNELRKLSQPFRNVIGKLISSKRREQRSRMRCRTELALHYSEDWAYLVFFLDEDSEGQIWCIGMLMNVSHAVTTSACLLKKGNSNLTIVHAFGGLNATDGYVDAVYTAHTYVFDKRSKYDEPYWAAAILDNVSLQASLIVTVQKYLKDLIRVYYVI